MLHSPRVDVAHAVPWQERGTREVAIHVGGAQPCAVYKHCVGNDFLQDGEGNANTTRLPHRSCAQYSIHRKQPRMNCDLKRKSMMGATCPSHRGWCADGKKTVVAKLENKAGAPAISTVARNEHQIKMQGLLCTDLAHRSQGRVDAIEGHPVDLPLPALPGPERRGVPESARVHVVPVHVGGGQTRRLGWHRQGAFTA